MLMLPPSVRIFLAAGVTDMRKQFDSLIALAKDVFLQDPFSGHIFAFCNRRRDRVKILFFDRSGFWLCAKRLEKGTFAWPSATTTNASIEMTSAELSLLLGGIDLSATRKRRWWDRDVTRA